LLLFEAACAGGGDILPPPPPPPTQAGAILLRTDGVSPPQDTKPPPKDTKPPPKDTKPPPKDTKPKGPSCLSFEHPFQGHCYSVVGLGYMDYASAAKLCAQHGAKVVSIHTAAENTFVNGLLTVTTQAAWIGLRRINGKFVWADGKPPTYTKWAPGEPSGGASEPCTLIWGPGLKFPQLVGRWNDAPCDKPGRDTVICKR
jgi:hypothetical protein